MAINQGSVAWLKSGGRMMSVERTYQELDGSQRGWLADCLYDAGTVQRTTIPTACLVETDPNPQIEATARKARAALADPPA